MQSLNFDINRIDPWKLTFHLPLHRYLSVFAYNAIYKYNIDPSLFLPVDDEICLLNLIFYPMRTIVSRLDENSFIDYCLFSFFLLTLSVGIMRFYRVFGFEMVNK